MSKIAKIIENNPNKYILFLGRVTNFTDEELRHFVEAEGMKYANSYQGEDPNTIGLLVLSSMLSPLEEQISYDLYDAGVQDLSLGAFESYLTEQIKPNTLLMSLKLSNDQSRLRRLLQNEAFSNEVYLKLFKMFDWGGEGIYENDTNRDMTIAFVKRFYRPDGFRDPAMIYAPTTVMNIAQESRDPLVLEAILTMPNHTIKVSRYEQHRPKNLRETVAFNEAINCETVRRLMGYNDTQIDYFLAGNPAVSSQEQKILYRRATPEVRLMLAHNPTLSDTLFEELLGSEDEVVQSLLRYQTITPTRFEWIKENPHLIYVGKNPEIGAVLDRLMALHYEPLDRELATNDGLLVEQLEILYSRYGNLIAKELALNPNTRAELLAEFYAQPSIEILKALASNPQTPTEILEALCQRQDRALNPYLAANPSVDIQYLRAFQLDPSLVRILANNPTYANAVLQGLGL